MRLGLGQAVRKIKRKLRETNDKHSGFILHGEGKLEENAERETLLMPVGVGG